MARKPRPYVGTPTDATSDQGTPLNHYSIKDALARESEARVYHEDHMLAGRISILEKAMHDIAACVVSEGDHILGDIWKIVNSCIGEAIPALPALQRPKKPVEDSLESLI